MSIACSIPLRGRDGSIRAYAIVDESDYASLSLFSWFLGTRGYAVRTEWRHEGDARRSRGVRMHRVILELEPGDSRETDHINRNKLDNRRSNLRICSSSENKQNVSAVGGTSAYRGVSWYRARQKWQATSRRDGKQVSIGYFDDELEAAIAAAEFRRQHMPFSVEPMIVADEMRRRGESE